MASKDIRKEKDYYSKTCQAPINQEQINEKIRKVAHRLYEKRGRISGHKLDDWLAAEKIVNRRCRIERSTKC